MLDNQITEAVIGGAIEVHKQLGPGLLEAIYEEALAFELNQRGIAFERQKPIPVLYKGIPLETRYRLDLLVEQRVIVELKAVDHLNDIHTAQVMTYLKISGFNLALLMNFNVVKMVNGIQRVVLGLPESPPHSLRKIPRRSEQ